MASIIFEYFHQKKKKNCAAIKFPDPRVMEARGQLVLENQNNFFKIITTLQCKRKHSNTEDVFMSCLATFPLFFLSVSHKACF